MFQIDSFGVSSRLADNGDRVRRSTSVQRNESIDRQIERNVSHYKDKSPWEIEERIRQLDSEWDVERALEVNASSLAMTGLILGMTVNKKWLALPAVVLGFLFQHGVQGWCPPLPILRSLGFRTRGEIDREKYRLLSML